MLFYIHKLIFHKKSKFDCEYLEMGKEPIINNKRIAKNTMFLYIRSAFTLFISLFTSRITLQVLGVENYGVQSAVGGVIAMFSIISGSLSSSISRFITFELGHGDVAKLNKIFSTSLNIQIIIGAIIVIFGETIGVWFLNSKMNIPHDRIIAANWVLQCAIWSFFIGLSQTPYSACIIGHEKMGVFAYFNIIDSILRLLIVYLLYIIPFDKLITLSVLGFIVGLLMRIAQRIYCIKRFPECHYHFIFDKKLSKEMTGFAGWSFLTNTAWIFNTQGINILINIFFGVTFNAARALAFSLESVIKRFYSDFMTAMNPQITKSYAAGEINEMNKLICRGTKLSYYLLFICSLPLFFEAYTVLHLWLGIVPEYTVLFFRLTLIASLIQLIGQAGVTACMATGNIKWYTIIMTVVGFLVFPLTWIAYKYGLPVETTYILFILIYLILDIIRLFIMNYLWGFPIILFWKDTIIPILKVSFLAIIPPLCIKYFFNNIFLSPLYVTVTSLASGVVIVFLCGLNINERFYFINKMKSLFKKI